MSGATFFGKYVREKKRTEGNGLREDGDCVEGWGIGCIWY